MATGLACVYSLLHWQVKCGQYSKFVNTDKHLSYLTHCKGNLYAQLGSELSAGSCLYPHVVDHVIR